MLNLLFEKIWRFQVNYLGNIFIDFFVRFEMGIHYMMLKEPEQVESYEKSNNMPDVIKLPSPMQPKRVFVDQC